MSRDVLNSLLPDITDRKAFVEFYFKNHFKSGPCDLASFLDRVMTDYDTQCDVVDDWIFKSMAPLLTLYNACLDRVVKDCPEKRAEALPFQKVTKRGSDPNVMEIKEKHRERRVRRLKSGGNGHVPPTPPLSSHASPDSQEARIEMQPRDAVSTPTDTVTPSGNRPPKKRSPKPPEIIQNEFFAMLANEEKTPSVNEPSIPNQRKEWATMMKSLESAQQNECHPGTEAQQSIPSILQDSVLNGFETIWLFEIRPYFQSVTREFVSDPERAKKTHIDFPKGVMAGISHVKELLPLKNFEEWDLSRFFAAITQMKRDQIKNRDIDKAIEEFREARNKITHASHGSESRGLSDTEWSIHINTARTCVPKIRGLPESNPRVKEIFKELKELEQFLRGEHAVKSATKSIDTDSEPEMIDQAEAEVTKRDTKIDEMKSKRRS